MLEAMIVTLREGIEAALIVGITLAYLQKINRPDLRKAVYSGLGAAFLGSIGIAVALSKTSYNEDIFEGWVMLGAAFFVITMVIFMARTARKLKGRIESKVGSFAERGSAVSLFAFVFLMVLREGVETVLILSAVTLNSSELMNFLGTLTGVALAVAFGVMFVKGSVRINLPKFFRITSVILVFVAIQLVVSGLHELSENGILPSSRKEMALIGPIVSNDLSFFVTILLLAGLMVLFEFRRHAPVPVAATGAERRKAEWTARRERLWMGSVYASSFLFILMITAQFIYARSKVSLSPAIEVTFTNGVVKIPVKEVRDGNLHRFVVAINGVPVRFLLIQKPDGKIATVFDACQICGSVGFYRAKKQLICKNCAAPINLSSVGEPGGCNPIPLQATTTADSVIVTQADLSAGTRWFAH